MPHQVQGLSRCLKDPVPAVTYWLWKRIQRHIRWHTGIVRVSLRQVLTPAAAPETEHLVPRRIIYFSNVLQPVSIQRLFLILSSRAFRTCELCIDLLLFHSCIIYLPCLQLLRVSFLLCQYIDFIFCSRFIFCSLYLSFPKLQFYFSI
jgi:hypothetical protein